MSDTHHIAPLFRWKWLITLSLLSSLLYLGVSLWTGWEQVAGSLQQVGLTGTLISLLLSLVNYGIRFIRWHYYLRRLGHPIPKWESFTIYLSGFALTLVPAKAGEIIRSVFLKQHGMSYTGSLAAFFSERFSDVLTVLALISIGLWRYESVQPTILIVVGIACVFLCVLHRKSLIERLCELLQTRLSERTYETVYHFAHIFLQARQCLSFFPLIYGLVWGIMAWGAEAYAFYLILSWMNTGVEWQTACFVYAFSMLIGGISFLPGGLGSAEATMIGFLLFRGVSQSDAVAATVIIRLATLWFAMLLGMIAMAFPKYTQPRLTKVKKTSPSKRKKGKRR